MTQAQINNYKKVLKQSVACQTGEEEKSFTINLSESKKLKFYFSKAYKDYVLCFSFAETKKFVFTRSMWKTFRKYINLIDGELNR